MALGIRQGGPQSLLTPALDRHDTAAVWALRLHSEPGGPTSITGTARFVPAIFYITATLLPGHTPARLFKYLLCRCSPDAMTWRLAAP